MASTVVIPPHQQGPPDAANGGVVAGLLTAPLGPSAQVRLEAAVPLEAPLRLEVDADGTSLWDGDRRLATGVRHDGPARPVATVSAADAAATVGVSAEDHPFPHCFVCGPAATHGMHLCVGPVADGSAMAMTWRPDPADTGLDLEGLAWAALDCPSGMAIMRDGEPCVLGTLTGRLARPLVAGEELVVVGRHLRTEGRKRFAATALHDGSGAAVAWSEATWITLAR